MFLNLPCCLLDLNWVMSALGFISFQDTCDLPITFTMLERDGQLEETFEDRNFKYFFS